MRIIILSAVMLLSACTEMRTQMKCHDGVLYVRDNGAWIQAKLYEANKCLPLEEPANGGEG